MCKKSNKKLTCNQNETWFCKASTQRDLKKSSPHTKDSICNKSRKLFKKCSFPSGSPNKTRWGGCWSLRWQNVIKFIPGASCWGSPAQFVWNWSESFPVVVFFCAAGGDPGRPCAVHARGSAQQPSRLRQRHRLGPSLLLPHLHRRWVSGTANGWITRRNCRRDHVAFPSSLSRRPPGSDLGHPADAPCHRGPHPGVHRWRRDQQRTVGLHAARLDRHLLQQLPGDPARLRQ